ncbi:AAA family ATPase [Candidatus Poribacteria bacterium]|nr:AAA family ATPase [Candidatus Poribacteria bacterium]MYG05842.1 AAA family ATPase [Candidatus Poribacteria bacterium]MYK22770.1 AAA family ATPase [Candidatus Poribacteria bacterium]
MKDSTFITRVVLKNYKSIAACDVRLHPLTFLVGRNGAGKSNFLDGLRFVADALNASLDHALRDRGGIKEVRRRSGGHPNHFSIRLDFALPDGGTGHYAFRIGTRSPGGYEVQTEECKIQNEILSPEVHFRVDKGTVTDKSVDVAPAAARDRLYLVNASGLPEFRPVYEAFSRMGFYNLNPDKIRNPQAPDPGDVLMRDGSNLTSVLTQLSPAAKQHIEEYLAIVVPGVHRVKVKEFGSMETLEFRQDIAGAKHPWRFPANNMSDGTLRVLGTLIALFQGGNEGKKRMSLVGIEEPELALHPAAADVLLDGLRDSAHKTQVIITSHSPDLLDNKDLDVESILAVEAHDGNTTIAPIDNASRNVVRKKLYTTGELLRRDQLEPDQASVISIEEAKQLRIFDPKSGKSSQKKTDGEHR